MRQDIYRVAGSKSYPYLGFLSTVNMNTVAIALCFAAVVAVAMGIPAPQQYRQPYQQQQFVTPQKQIAIISQSSDLQQDGSFNYNFQSENGISEEAYGSIKVLDPEHQAQVMQGRYAYTAPDGTPIEATWYADETGFHIEGAHLPKAPPVPEAIAKSLEYIRSLPPSKEGQYKP